MQITFRKANRSDHDHSLEMIRDFYAIDQYPFDQNKASENFLELIQSPDLGRFWILEIENEIIGYLILTFGYSFEYGGRDAFVDEFFLKKSYRGKGFGTEVLLQLETHAQDLGVHAIHLEVESTNEAGKQLYLKSGFYGNNRSLLTRKINQ